MATSNKLWPNKYQIDRRLDDIMFAIDDQMIEHDSLHEFRINVVDLCIFQNRLLNPRFPELREKIWKETTTLCMIADELLAYTEGNGSSAAVST